MSRHPIERAARALCSLDGHPEDAKMDGKPMWQDYLPEVRAVLNAIRDPGPAAKRAGALEGGFDGHYGDDRRNRNAAALTWDAMLSAMLADHK